MELFEACKYVRALSVFLNETLHHDATTKNTTTTHATAERGGNSICQSEMEWPQRQSTSGKCHEI